MTEFLPDPDPDAFPALEDEHLLTVDSEHLFVHLYDTAGAHAMRWNQFRRHGPTTARFDHHPAGAPTVHPHHGTWYGGLEHPGQHLAITTSVAEVFQNTRVVSLSSQQRWMVITGPARPLILLRLDSSWITRAGGNAAISSGPRTATRRWARAIYRHYPQIDGLCWRSSVYPPGTAIVLWERRDEFGPFTLPRLNRPLRDLIQVLEPAARELRYGLTL